MVEARNWEFEGVNGTIAVTEWPNEAARYVALLSHGYGEHIGRYEHVAEALVAHGAAVYGPDHVGHGRSSGERVLIADFEDVVSDLRTVAERAATAHPGLPIVLIGHSMGGLIAARYTQRYQDDLTALVLSGPLLGRSEALSFLLSLDEIPDIPIDPDTLSRDPAVGKAYGEDPLVWHGPFKRQTIEAINRCMTTINEQGGFGALPVLYLHGGDDQLVPQADTLTGIEYLRAPGLSEHTYPGARHEIFNETNQEEVIGDVLAHLDRALG